LHNAIGGTVSVLDVFRPAPPIDEIQDPDLVKKSYKYWRLRTFYAMWAGYAFFYFTRKSFAYIAPVMHSEFGLSMGEIGLLGSILYIAYGASKFLSGVFVDKSSPRYCMAIGLILTGIFNVFFGMSSSFWAFALFWGLNGIFQGWGWPGCAKLLTHWYSHSERGRWWGVLNTSHNIGGSVIRLLAAACAAYYGWRFAMFLPGFICIAAGLFIMNRLRDTPQSLGLPPIEKFRNDYTVAKEKVEKSTASAKQILVDYVLNNKYVWVLAIAYFFVYVIRTAISDCWGLMYLMEVKNYTLKQASVCLVWFEWGGFCGSLAAGWASDLIFKGKRNPVNVLFILGVLVLLFAFKAMNGVFSPILDSVFVFLFGFFIFGPQMLIGMAAVEVSNKKAAATANGFVGCFAYIGAAAAGWPLGAIRQSFGWDAYLLTLFICGTLGALIMFPLWSIKANPKEAETVPTT
jgi:OPA family sugar phosphate sensor protein UhpC-like MFS transporter